MCTLVIAFRLCLQGHEHVLLSIVAKEPLYSVRLVKASDGKSYDWSIWRDELEIARSTEASTTLAEALLDAARASADLLFLHE